MTDTVENGIQDVSVKIDVATLAMSSRGSITGVVAICGEDRCFPSPTWSDFPVVILTWWLEPVSRILQGKTNFWECRFMDGPEIVQLVQREDDIWSITGSHNDSVEFKATVSCRAFIQSLLSAVREILSACKQRGWRNRDIDNLASSLKQVDF